MDLDKTDWKILNALIENSRSPLSMIAKKSRISKQSCFYRIKRMESEQLITGYKAKIDLSRLGYSTYAVYLRMFNISEEEEDALISKILLIPQVRWLVGCTGKWDIMLAVSSQNNIGFNDTLKKILNISNNKILDYETSIILSTKDMWLRDPLKEHKELIESSTLQVETVDEIDHKIIAMLQDNARIESTKISQQVKITPEAVAYRIKNLIKKGIIHEFGVGIDKEKLGLTWYQIQFLLNDPVNEENKAISKLLMTGDVGYMVRTLGKWNFEIHLYCKDVQEFRAKLLRIRSLLSGSIRDYETNIILKKYKSKTFVK